MSEAKHTPGPWHRNIRPASKYATVWAGRNTHVARVVTDGLSEDAIEANINLIAAAPELLAAAEALLPEVQRLRDCLAKVHDGYPDELAAAEVRASELRAVIAKVRG